MKKIALVLFIAVLLYGCSGNSSENASKSEEGKDLTPEQTVKSFITALGKKDFENAFQKQKIEAWGNIEKFSSNESFGGIVSTEIKKIEAKPDENGMAVIYAEAFYADSKNGDNTFKQNFYLKQFAGEWKIVKMKVLGSVQDKTAFKEHKFEKKDKNSSGLKVTVKSSILLPEKNEELSKLILKSLYKEISANDADTYFKKTYESLTESFKDSEGTDIEWEYDEETEIIFDNGTVLCYSIRGGGFMGGAHGFNFRKYFNFMFPGNKIINIKDVLKNPSSRKMQDLIYKKLKEANKITDAEMTDYFFELPISPNENFYITDKGIGFYYNEYEIAAFALGPSDVFFTFEEIKSELKDDFLKKL